VITILNVDGVQYIQVHNINASTTSIISCVNPGYTVAFKYTFDGANFQIEN